MRHPVFALLLLLSRTALASCPAPVLLQGVSQPAVSNPLGIAVADFDKDGKLDYAVAGKDGFTAVYPGAGDGTFSAAAQYKPGGDQPTLAYPIARDFNSDTYVDIAVIDTSTNELVILLNVGDGTFTASKRAAGTTNISALQAGDFNGDGKADVVVTGLYFSVLLGAGNGTFSSAQTFVGPRANPVYATSADVNRDGTDELVTLVKDSYGPNSAIVVFRLVNSTFTPLVIASIADDWGDVIQPADLNGDGFPDLVTAHYSKDVLVVMNDGAGGFLPPIDHQIDFVVRAVVATDIDQDGHLDLVFGAINAIPSVVPVLYGKGDGTFRPIEVVPIGMAGVPNIHIFALASGDLNGDGRPDLLLADAFNDVVHIIKNHCPDKPTTTKLTQRSETSLVNEYVGLTTTVTFDDGSTPAGRVLNYDNGRFRGAFPFFPEEPGVIRSSDQTLAPGTHLLTARFEGNETYMPSEASVTHTVFRLPFGPPQVFRSDANNGNAVWLTWVATDDSESFEISRMEDGKWSVVARTDKQSYFDTPVDATKGYFYRVRAFKTGDGSPSAYTPADATLGHTVDAARPGDLIRAQDLAQMRVAIDKIRTAAGLQPFDWTDPELVGSQVKKIHMVELQTALNQAYIAAGGIPWTYSPLVEGVTAIRASDFQLIASFMW